MDHKCIESNICTCNTLADSPNEDCPVHMDGTWPPRCCICGRFMEWSQGVR